MSEEFEPVQVMTVGEISEYLKLARSTVYRLAQTGEIPARKVGGTWRFSRKQVDRWLEQPDQFYRPIKMP